MASAVVVTGSVIESTVTVWLVDKAARAVSSEVSSSELITCAWVGVSVSNLTDTS